MSTSDSTTPPTDPPADPWDHYAFSKALKHVLKDLIQVQLTDVNAPPLIISSIQEERITQAYELVDLDRNFDTEVLQTTRLSKAKNGAIPAYHRHRLKHVQHYAQAYSDANQRRYPTDDQWIQVTLQDVRDQWPKRVNPSAVAGPPPPTARSKPAPSPADTFEKGIRRDPDQFPTLSNQAKFTSWQKEFETTIHAQNLPNIINPNYTPATDDEKRLWRFQQDYVFKVFYTKLLTDKGKGLVQLHSTDRDAQTLYQDLLGHARDSTAAAIEVTKYTDFLTNSRLDSTWRGTTAGYVAHWRQQLRSYEQLVSRNEYYNDGVKKRMLSTAVESLSKLDSIRDMDEIVTARGSSSSTRMDFDTYAAVLEAACVRYDNDQKRTARAQRTRNRHANVHAYDPLNLHVNAHEGDYIDNGAVFVDDVDGPEQQVYNATQHPRTDRTNHPNSR